MEKLKEASEFIFSSYKRTAAILFIAALTLAIPVTLGFLSQNQDIRQQASQVCENVAADIMLVIDKSGSMDAGPGNNKPINKAKTAANNFVDIIASDSDNRIGAISYSSNNSTNLHSALTANFNSVKSSINSINASGYTCIECGIKRANDEISANKRPTFKNAVVLLTDGRANATVNHNLTSFELASKAALDRAKAGFETNGTVYFTIGLGSDIQTDLLQEIANLSGGKYFAAPSADDLQSIYTEISQIVGKASISGFVYDDQNNNGQLDENEIKLPGWILNLKEKESSTSVGSFTTDASGGFNFAGLCGGEYTLSVENQTGWQVTSPANGQHDIILLDGDSNTEGNFGVQSGTISPSPTSTPFPTPTCTPRPTDTTGQTEPDGGWCASPETTTLGLSLTLRGIGNASNSALGINNDPERPDRIAEVLVLNANNQPIIETSQTITYNPTTGTYEGTVSLGESFESGAYLVRARMDNTLWRTIPGIQNISAGTQNQMPTTRLVSGDTDQNNEINIIDYNAFISCLQLGECGQDEDEQNISRLVDKVISFFKNLIPKKVFAQSASQNTCNMLRQQLTYLQTNNLCISNICTSLTNSMQRMGCSTTPSPAPTTAPGVSPTGISMPANLMCSTNNSSCPSGYTCRLITSNFGACIPSLTGTPSQTPSNPSPTSTSSPTAAQNPSPTASQPSATPTPFPTPNPTVNTAQKALFDFDDNGIIDLPDLNILLNSFEERLGD